MYYSYVVFCSYGHRIASAEADVVVNIVSAVSDAATALSLPLGCRCRLFAVSSLSSLSSPPETGTDEVAGCSGRPSPRQGEAITAPPRGESDAPAAAAAAVANFFANVAVARTVALVHRRLPRPPSPSHGRPGARQATAPQRFQSKLSNQHFPRGGIERVSRPGGDATENLTAKTDIRRRETI